ncbi:MAG: DUF2914 domain-containing protein [Candidatus Zambryskibacteria bacterium]|nr:DUF2914 domain-containing protein [Candidatus Zambryskibacteria bacterium]
MIIKKFTYLKEYYERYEKSVSIGSLLFGFILDSLTLQRIDALRENVWIAGNIFLVGLSIILLNRGKGDAQGFWLPNILQFGFGALLGAFFIFYFRSAALVTAWPFLLIILAAMVANELFQKRYARLAFQLSFFYLSVFSFLIFLLPLLLHSIGAMAFLFSGAVSIVAIWVFVNIMKRFAREKFLENRTHIWRLIAIIFISVNVLYFTNLIPPIPLSLKDIGIYHSIARNSAGDYLVSGEEKGLIEFFHLREKVHWSEGQPLYAYSAIFSPGSLNTNIVHEWQFRNKAGEWTTSTRIPISISGGRTEGFRTYSTKYNLSPGLWRVNVATQRGQLLGRKTFEIIVSDAEPALEIEVKK